MEDKPHVQARRTIIAKEIEADCLANIARKAGKPDRQINDMVAGRKAFGDRVARDLEPLLRPDLAPGWLVFATPETAAAHAPFGYQSTATESSRPARDVSVPTYKAQAETETDLKARAQMLADEAHYLAGLIMALPEAEREELKTKLKAAGQGPTRPQAGNLIGTTRKKRLATTRHTG